jgi:hypothetical protein
MSISLDAEDPRPVPQAAPVLQLSPRAAPPPAARAWAWWLMRLLVTVQAVDAFLQPVLAGRFLSGDFAMLTLHRTNGTIVGGVSMGVLVASLIFWRLARPSGWIVLGLALLGPLAGLQILLGFTRVLGIHVPLGVAFITLSAWLVVWLWRNGPDRPRVARQERP